MDVPANCISSSEQSVFLPNLQKLERKKKIRETKRKRVTRQATGGNMAGLCALLNGAEIPWRGLLNSAEVPWRGLLDSTKITWRGTHGRAEITWLSHFGLDSDVSKLSLASRVSMDLRS